jgi:predicted transcriptional regulator
MNDNEKYISEIFGVETAIIPLENRLFQQLPLYITASYQVNETTFYGQRVCLLIAKTGKSELTPDQLYKQMLFVSQKLELPVVFVFNKILSYNIKRLIRKGVNFITPNKQMFIPALMMDLRKMPVSITQKAELLTSNAQLFLLYHLQKELLNGLTTQEVAGKFNQSYLTANRAVKCLKELGLCNLTGGKEKQIQFVAKGKELWQKAQPFFQNPVERIVFTDEILQYTQSNINALAHYTMLNDEAKRYYAVGKDVAKNLAGETNKYADDNVIEIWRYFPDLLSDSGFVDKLSLYLLLKNDRDVRVQNELEQMINGIKWLEE